MDYKKKYLKYKLKYLTAKKLYGGMDPGPDENEEMDNQGMRYRMGNQGMRDRSNALTPEDIIEAMNDLHLGPAEDKNTCMNVEELGENIEDLTEEVRDLSEEVEDLAEEVKYLSDMATDSDSDSSIDSLYKKDSSSQRRMDMSFEEIRQKRKSENINDVTPEDSPKLKSKKPRREGDIQVPGRLEYGPMEPVTSPAGAIRVESDEEKE